jgi:hypothetical protein
MGSIPPCRGQQIDIAQLILAQAEVLHLDQALSYQSQEAEMITQTSHPDPWPARADSPRVPDANGTGLRTGFPPGNQPTSEERIRDSR